MEDTDWDLVFEPKLEQLMYLEYGQRHAIAPGSNLVKAERMPSDIEDDVPLLDENVLRSVLGSDDDDGRPVDPDALWTLPLDDVSPTPPEGTELERPSALFSPLRETCHYVAQKRVYLDEVCLRDDKSDLYLKKQSKDERRSVQKASRARRESRKIFEKNLKDVVAKLQGVSKTSGKDIDEHTKYRRLQGQTQSCNVLNETSSKNRNAFEKNLKEVVAKLKDVTKTSGKDDNEASRTNGKRFEKNLEDVIAKLQGTSKTFGKNADDPLKRYRLHPQAQSCNVFNEASRKSKQTFERNVKDAVAKLNGGTKTSGNDIDNSANVCKGPKVSDSTLAKDSGYACNVCAKSYKTKHYLREHILAHNGATFKCPSCDKVFAKYSYLQSHRRTVHDRTGNHVTCRECGKTFSRKSGLKTHVEAKHSDHRPFPCPVCDRAFSKRYLLYKHVKIHANRKAFKCDRCGQAFSRPANMRRHVAGHAEDRTFPCRLCDERFISDERLRAHVTSSHGGGRGFACRQCDMTFALAGTLRRHLLTHSDSREFRCDVCGKGFHTRSNLVRHGVVHSADRRSACGECGETFKTDLMLRRHVNIAHGSERNVACRLCDKKFADKHDLWSHAVSHSERRFLCEVCGKGFKRRLELKLHVGSHRQPAKDLSCALCDRLNAFSSVASYRRHLREKHPGTLTASAKH